LQFHPPLPAYLFALAMQPPFVEHSSGSRPVKPVAVKKGSDIVERAVAACFPDFYRALKFLHMEHVLQFRSKFQVVLTLSCIISIVFMFVWASDIFNMTCFRRTPWTEKGLARFTCLYQFIGCIIFLFMFRHSLVALCYYDDEHEELRLKKQRCLVELRQQCSEVLVRATKRATDLCDALTGRLGSEIKVHVKNMRTILERFGQSYPHAPDLYEQLVIAMATHLHDLREPAFREFRRLIDLSGDPLLINNLDEGNCESMINLLAESRPDGTPLRPPLTGRAGTLSGDDHGFVITGTDLTSRIHDLCSCFFSSSTNRQKKMGLSAQEEHELREKFKITSNDRRNSPDKVVLKPVNVVLSWLGKVHPEPPSKTAAASIAQSLTSATSVVQSSFQGMSGGQGNLNSSPTTSSWLEKVHDSRMCRSFATGTMFCMFYLVFYAVTLREVVSLLREGKCEYNEIACTAAMGRKTMGLCAMACYVMTMCVVIRNIDRVDKVLQATEELRDMQDFKHEIDHLNTHAFAVGEDGKEGMLTEIANCLDKKKAIIDEFLQRNIGVAITLHQYEELRRDMTDGAEALPQPTRHISDHGQEAEPLMLASADTSRAEP